VPASRPYHDYVEFARFFFVNHVDCASATIECIGDAVERRSYGKLRNIEPGKLVIRLKKIFRKTARPTQSFTPTLEQKESGLVGWKFSKTTLDKVWMLWTENKQDPLLVVALGCVKIPAQHITFQQEPQPNNVEAPVPTAEMLEPATGRQEPVAPVAEVEQNVADTEVAGVSNEIEDNDDGDGDDDEDEPASKAKNDIFHQFQDLGMRKDDPNHVLVSRLLTQCTFEFNHTNYYARVAQVLEEKAGVSGTAALLDHFYFNKEWWRRRVRMMTPKRIDHANEVKRLHKFVRKSITSYNAKLAD
jgi:hypothetical protein